MSPRAWSRACAESSIEKWSSIFTRWSPCPNGALLIPSPVEGVRLVIACSPLHRILFANGQPAPQEAIERQQPLRFPGSFDLSLELAVGRLELPPAGGIGMMIIKLEGVVGINRKDAIGIITGAHDLELEMRVAGTAQPNGVATVCPLQRTQHFAQGRLEKRFQRMLRIQVEENSLRGRDSAGSSRVGQGQERGAGSAQVCGRQATHGQIFLRFIRGSPMRLVFQLGSPMSTVSAMQDETQEDLAMRGLT